MIVKKRKLKRLVAAKMCTPKAKSLMLVLASAICLLALAGSAYGTAGHYLVKGKVYCDTCRVNFETRLSEPIKGAKVRLECRERAGSTDTTFTSDTETDGSGNYQIQVDGGDHEEELCEVTLIQSPNPDCNELAHDPFHRIADRVNLADNGIASGERLVNPLGFRKKEALPGCAEVLRELGFTRQGDLAP